VHSTGANVPTGCSCNAGFLGSVVGRHASPFYSGSCSAVACPANSDGSNLPLGCTCDAGYSGSITKSTTSPLYTGSCTAVACPANSAGSAVPSGCSCNSGYTGTITRSTSSPFYTGTCAQDCVEGSWSSWATCSLTCGTGTQARTRTLQQPQTGGIACGVSTQSQSCNAFSCPVNCVEGSWGGWGSCSLTCGTGSQTRTRTLTQPQHGGTACGVSSQSQSCNAFNCPVNCVEGSWGGWGGCSLTCGTGSQTRTRSLTQPQNGGVSCGVSSQSQSCNAFSCPVNCVEAGWGSWSTCTVTCGSGTQSRTRSLTQPQHGGTACGASSQSQSCNTAACPVTVAAIDEAAVLTAPSMSSCSAESSLSTKSTSQTGSFSVGSNGDCRLRICSNVVDSGTSCGSSGSLSTTGFQGASLHNPPGGGWYIVDFGSSVSVNGLRAYTHWYQRTPTTITLAGCDSSSCSSSTSVVTLQCGATCPSSHDNTCEGAASGSVSSYRYYKITLGPICTQSSGAQDSIVDMCELSFFGSASASASSSSSASRQFICSVHGTLIAHQTDDIQGNGATDGTCVTDATAIKNLVGATNIDCGTHPSQYPQLRSNAATNTNQCNTDAGLINTHFGFGTGTVGCECHGNQCFFNFANCATNIGTLNR